MGSSERPGERSAPEATPSIPADRVVNITDGLPAAPVPQESVSRATVWLHRISLVVFVIFCIELGMLLAVLPWTPVWVRNGIVAPHALLKSILQENFVRGLVSGCGLVDIWIGIWEAVHYKDPVAGNHP
jgi:hypothetical protein